MQKVKFVSICSDDFCQYLLDDKGRLWRCHYADFKLVESPDEPSPDIPTVYGKMTRKRGGHMIFEFKCEYCKNKHTHGWSNDPDVNKHRIAHCADDESPYNKTGYYIAIKDNYGTK